MNKADFITQLAAKYHKIMVPVPAVAKADFDVRKAEGFSFYGVGVYDLVGGAIKRANVFFQVEDEGLSTEVAYWEEKESPDFLTRPLDNTPVDAANAFITANKPEGYLTHKIIEGDRDLLFALVDIWIETEGVAAKKQYWIGQPVDTIVMFPVAA